jgi:hypothetical protein
MNFAFSREGEKEQTCAWNVLGNGVLLDGLWRDLLQRTWKRGRVKLDHPLLQVEVSITSVAYKRGLENGITYKRDLTTQYVKPNKYCI